jgi:hypothetical protein
MRTDFGADPRRSIDRAKASTSAVDTSPTRRDPIAGEMWTRCIDSQFCRRTSERPAARAAPAWRQHPANRPRLESLVFQGFLLRGCPRWGAVYHGGARLIIVTSGIESADAEQARSTTHPLPKPP